MISKRLPPPPTVLGTRHSKQHRCTAHIKRKLKGSEVMLGTTVCGGGRVASLLASCCVLVRWAEQMAPYLTYATLVEFQACSFYDEALCREERRASSSP